MAEAVKVDLSPYVIRFSWVFAAFFVAAALLIAATGMSNNTGLAIGIVMASAVSAGQKFLGIEKRPFNAGERLRISLYSVLAAGAISLLGLLARASFPYLGLASDRGRIDVLINLEPSMLVIVIAFLALVTFGLTFVSYSAIQKLIYRGMVKRGEL